MDEELRASYRESLITRINALENARKDNDFTVADALPAILQFSIHFFGGCQPKQSDLYLAGS